MIFGVDAYEQDELGRAIVERPESEDDLTAIRHAVLQQWVPMLDHAMIARRYGQLQNHPSFGE